MAASLVLLAGAAPAWAQDADTEESAKSPITISGSATLASDYRFRGVSQTDKEMAIQGGLTVTHDSGFYVGAWGSNLSGWGTFGGANMELDLIAGFKTGIGDATLDTGLVWYMYPGGADDTDFAELYAKLSGTTGPLTLTGGVAYAPKQYALANVSSAPNSRGQKDDNLYLFGDGAVAVANTPFTLKAHVGYSDGNPGLGPNGTSVSPTGSYWDWLLGIDTTWRNLTLGVAYVDTDISGAAAARLQPNFSKGQDGVGSIADGAVLLTLTASF
ncbi:TorF family putative porin [Novosphingobium album (ex Liu et al. 2023)]|uniref:TorF family putative porin n=1 Tax=Novosphingobium album (ex Liu et al. 2023) TaxID=3031130 RepID=A0ABT5WN48_9SPHN|nr:TorF family putative porin [Novosphingobium album (ex Liu et al. 2023)]MDE8651471.1 TorF family putative porin [Novosphingobium album (ex Liu et al. 2023)]